MTIGPCLAREPRDQLASWVQQKFDSRGGVCSKAQKPLSILKVEPPTGWFCVFSSGFLGLTVEKRTPLWKCLCQGEICTKCSQLQQLSATTFAAADAPNAGQQVGLAFSGHQLVLHLGMFFPKKLKSQHPQVTKGCHFWKKNLNKDSQASRSSEPPGGQAADCLPASPGHRRSFEAEPKRSVATRPGAVKGVLDGLEIDFNSSLKVGFFRSDIPCHQIPTKVWFNIGDWYPRSCMTVRSKTRRPMRS